MKRLMVLLVISALASACATYSVYRATPRNPYLAPIKAGKDAVISAILRELAARNLQVAMADRQSGLITVANVALRPGHFDCDHLLADGQPTYAFTGAAGTVQFLIEGNQHSSQMRATVQIGPVSTVNHLGIQRLGYEVCYSTHSFEDEIFLSVTRIEK